MTTLEQRLDERVEIIMPADCWIWTGALTSAGYGSLSFKGKTTLAHRLSYVRHRGAIPPGLVLDHLCRVPACINPDHLEPVTMQVNSARGSEATKMVCDNGHSLKDAYVFPSMTGRVCRTCRRLNNAKFRLRYKHLGKKS